MVCDPTKQITANDPNSLLKFQRNLQLVPGTNFQPRMSAGIELQVFLPVINAPFRIYWAYNPLRLNKSTNSSTFITRDMFPNDPNGPNFEAGEFSYQNAIANFAPKILLREPARTFRFTVATTF